MVRLNKKHLKYALASAGAVYLALFAAYLVYREIQPSVPAGPSELEAHPERQDEILAQRRAEELKEQLGLSDEQAQRIGEIFASQGRGGPSPGEGDFRDRWRGMQDQLARVLTPEQQALMQQNRGPFPGGGPRGPMMTPERIESLKQKMTPEQKARFEKHLQEWEQRRQQWGGRGPGGNRGPGGRQR
jgi:Spy/CpxP family protein refolding chaperone